MPRLRPLARTRDAALPGLRLCPGCGLALTGPAAAELWRTDQQLLELRRHRHELIDSLRRNPPVAGPQAAQPVAPPRRRPSWTGQRLLLATGALLVVAAAVGFLALAWSALGVAGQVAVMGLLTVAAAAASLTLSSRRLTATAETWAPSPSGSPWSPLPPQRPLSAGLGGRSALR